MARTFIIAEAGVNHDGDTQKALTLVDVAARAGADAVKFQAFAADRLASVAAPKATYQCESTNPEESQLEMLRALELPEESYHRLRERSLGHGIEFMSSVFDEPSVELLERVGVARYKLPSGEITNTPLLDRVARTGKPVILSTGMCTLGECEDAVRTLTDAGCSDLVLLHCTSAYPADPADVNLRAMETLRRAFGWPVGLSDHTCGVEVACAAVALGASVIEKHFTLDHTAAGPDHRASLDPDQLEQLVHALRNVELALGTPVKRVTTSEHATRRVARKSLVAARDLPAGARLERADVVAKRPGTGIPPSALEVVLGRCLKQALRSDETLHWDHLA